MASLDSLSVRNLASKGVVTHIPSILDSVGIILKYVGTGSVTSVTVTTATKIVMITSDGGTDQYDFSSYTTLKALVDAINADGIFIARLLDASGDLASAKALTDGAAAISSDGYYRIKVVGTAIEQVAALISYDRLPDENGALRNGHRVHLQTIDTTQTYAGGTLVIDVIERNIATQAETILVTYAGAASTVAKSISFASGQGKITSNNGCEILVRSKGGTTTSVAVMTVVGIVE